MAITVVQSVTAGSGTLTLNGVAAGNTLLFFQSFFRNVSTGAGLTAPTDTNGTFSTSSAGTPATFGGHDVGIGLFHQYNVASGTHTVTPNATSDWNATLIEVSGLVTASALDVTTNAKTDSSAHTSQVTGTTASTAQSSELVIIGCTLGASTGASDVGWTDPVSGFTTLFKVSDDSIDVATFHAYKTISSIGTQSATFNWTNNDASNASHAAIATYKAYAEAVDVQDLTGAMVGM